MGNINAEKYNIQQAFSGSFYIVPEYQREYVWKEKQVNKLLQDIVDEYDTARDEEYFIGTILVSKNSQGKTLEVIDGQQRLTTLFLILCAFKHLLKIPPETINMLLRRSHNTPDGIKVTNYCLDLCYEGAKNFCNVVFEAPSYEDLKKQLTKPRTKLSGSLKNLTTAYQTIIQFLSEKYSTPKGLDLEALHSFYWHLINRVVFIQIETRIGSTLKIFETINERGISLNSMDLLKNLLFTHVQKKQFSDLNKKWKNVTKPLEKKSSPPLRFLRYYLMANYQIKGVGTKKEPIIRENQIYDWLTDEENAERCGYQDDPFSFVSKLIEGVTTYIHFSEGRDRHGRASIPLADLHELCKGSFSLHLILLLATANLPDDQFDYLVRRLESFLFYVIVTKSHSNDIEFDFSLWANELREIVKCEDGALQEQRLQDFVANKLKKGADKKTDEFEVYFKQLSSSSFQKYRLRYVLAKLTQYVDMQYRGGTEAGRVGNYINTNIEIEHILPNKPKRGFKLEFEQRNPDHEYDDIKNQLGNLTLLEKAINNEAGRKSFDEKKQSYEKSGYYLTRSISRIDSIGNDSTSNRINEMLKSYTEWDAPQIKSRQKMLMELARKVWDFQ